MGYTTDFFGSFKLDKPLTVEHAAYIRAFNRTRRMKRNAKETEKFPDPVRIAAGLPVGVDGGLYVGDSDNFGQTRTADIKDSNSPPSDQPGLWCQWTTTEDGSEIVWDGVEKFYSYVEWLRYILNTFLIPWGYVLNGAVEWQGEDPADAGQLVVSNNKVTVLNPQVR